MIRLIRYKELEKWKKTGKWILVYGRRKTGKSFFVRNFTKWDKYFFIGRSGEIFEEDKKISYDVFLRAVFDSIKNNKTVVIDEIQRLPAEFHDRLHKLGVTGNLVAVSSTLWIAKKLIGEKSPLLGLFSEFKVNIIDETDILKNLLKYMENPKQLIELSAYLREPWLLPLWEKTGKNCLPSMASNTKITVPALIGEIFSEEDKQMSSVYEGILKAISDGKRVSGKITNYLFSLNLIPAQNPSLVHPYLSVLHKLGLLEKIKVFGRNKYLYYHASPVTDLFYYMDAKYGFSERELPEKQAENILKEKMPLHVEQFLRSLLSKIFGLGKEIISEKDYEVDIALTDFRKLKIACEVKWKNKIREKEISRIENILNKFNCRKILIVPDKKSIEKKPEGIEVWDAKTILGIIKGSRPP